jgi:DNA-binding XRE family transcriptional regulator
MIDEARLYSMVRERIFDLRKNHPDKKTTQENLARAIGIKRSTLTNIELGNQRPPLHVIYRICKYFDIRLDELLPALPRVDADASDRPTATTYKVGADEHVLQEQGKTAQVLMRLRKQH